MYLVDSADRSIIVTIEKKDSNAIVVFIINLFFIFRKFKRKKSKQRFYLQRDSKRARWSDAHS